MQWARGRNMLRIRINVFLAAVLTLGVWACAPRGAPAPLVMGGPASEYPVSAHGKGSVVVEPGDTLYAISRYHKTALQALIEANDLTPPFIIKPGQVLQLPGGPQTSPAAVGSKAPIASAALTPPVSSVAPIVAMRPQSSAVAKPPLIPDRSGAESDASASTGDPTPGAAEDQSSGFSEAAQEVRDSEPEIVPLPKPVPARQHLAAREAQHKALITRPAESRTTPVVARAADQKLVRFLWPAKGPILSDFGSKQNGLHNDGINIAMPPNGPVIAAGDGIVSYAGNGLRGYGNLLLVRHEGGWVTAYAHNSELLVEKGATVRRGQVIAKAGRSGGVAQDQLHFEIRQGAKAVDPKPLLVGG